jgi:hypothetical protein
MGEPPYSEQFYMLRRYCLQEVAPPRTAPKGAQWSKLTISSETVFLKDLLWMRKFLQCLFILPYFLAFFFFCFCLRLLPVHALLGKIEQASNFMSSAFVSELSYVLHQHCRYSHLAKTEQSFWMVPSPSVVDTGLASGKVSRSTSAALKGDGSRPVHSDDDDDDDHGDSSSMSLGIARNASGKRRTTFSSLASRSKKRMKVYPIAAIHDILLNSVNLVVIPFLNRVAPPVATGAVIAIKRWRWTIYGLLITIIFTAVAIGAFRLGTMPTIQR